MCSIKSNYVTTSQLCTGNLRPLAPGRLVLSELTVFAVNSKLFRADYWWEQRWHWAVPEERRLGPCASFAILPVPGAGASPGTATARNGERKEGRKQGRGEEGKGWAPPARFCGETAARGRVSIPAPAHPGAHERYLAGSGRSSVRPRWPPGCRSTARARWAPLPARGPTPGSARRSRGPRGPPTPPAAAAAPRRPAAGAAAARGPPSPRQPPPRPLGGVRGLLGPGAAPARSPPRGRAEPEGGEQRAGLSPGGWFRLSWFSSSSSELSRDVPREVGRWKPSSAQPSPCAPDRAGGGSEPCPRGSGTGAGSEPCSSPEPREIQHCESAGRAGSGIGAAGLRLPVPRGFSSLPVGALRAALRKPVIGGVSAPSKNTLPLV